MTTLTFSEDGIAMIDEDIDREGTRHVRRSGAATNANARGALTFPPLRLPDVRFVSSSLRTDSANEPLATRTRTPVRCEIDRAARRPPWRRTTS